MGSLVAWLFAQASKSFLSSLTINRCMSRSILLVTQNRHKVEEASAILARFAIKVEQLAEEKTEPKEMPSEEVARMNAEMSYARHKRPLAVEDTGVFFSAYPDFPGSHPKLMFSLLGYKGLLKLLEGEDRTAYFRTVIAYADENGVKVFEGKMVGIISRTVHDIGKDVMPYERILLYKGRSLSSYTREEKNLFSHRSLAFTRLGEHLILSS